MRVLAIDPGFDRLGLAVLEGDPSRPTLVASECIEPEKGEPAARLVDVSQAVHTWIKIYKPELVAVETLFFSTNKKTALAVAEARGVVLREAGSASLPVRQCSPQEVKLAVTGYGAADKKSVMGMVSKLIALPEKKRRLDDEFDAIALGIAALAGGYPHPRS